ncbi:hypothetical protein [Vitiosangium sp. GDMCC 1.1324]|uniref:hypothetical protein n=1 Tax=Vitiosangium sp. (strain GDMCC 1.1324) TaxID=2138576 RepID=UPI000D3AAE0B|nr:hypothetical protein [Vitiosangium sp. GDMCC 1.1324]PTL79088.1 hypothetical protein DAT35_36375 [Vitiosangium sp. GDMCC 1.1324]
MQGWTQQEAAAQPYWWILAIAADHLLEAQDAKAEVHDTGAAPRTGSEAGRRRVTRTTNYCAT